MVMVIGSCLLVILIVNVVGFNYKMLILLI